MNAKMLLLTMVTAAALSACGPAVTMKNVRDGQVATCRSGYLVTGMASERVASDLLTECVDEYSRRGYTVVAASR